MKKFLIITGYITGGILLCLYLAFLFVLPAKINLNAYKSDVQNLVHENTGLDLDFGKIKVITTPLLEAGVKIQDVNVKLPDGSVLFHTDKIKGKVFLPALLWLNVRVTCAQVNNPRINIDIEGSEQYKAAKVFEDLINKKRQDKLQHPEKYAIAQEPYTLPFDPSRIKVNVPSLKLNNYLAIIDDIQAGHQLKFKGDNITISYRNGITGRIKADAHLFNDNNENITANVDIDSFLPKFILPEKEDEDLEAVYKIPFVNPVSIYRDYDLKSNISSKLKIRKTKRHDHLKMNGFFNVEDTTVKMSGLQLPKSYFKLSSKGFNTDIDSNLFVTDKEYIKVLGHFHHDGKPWLDMDIKSSKVQLNNLLNIAKAYLSTIHLKTDIDKIFASGYFISNAHIKTNFKDLKSYGKIIIRDGNISDNNIGLLFNDIKANLIFDNDIFKIQDTHILINNKPLNISGKITNDGIADFNIKGEKIPLVSLYKAFAPKEFKTAYNLTSGNFSIDAKLKGDVKTPASILKTDLEDFVLKDSKNAFTLSNKKVHLGIANYLGMTRGRINNSGFEISVPSINSVIKNESLITDIDNKNIVIQPSTLRFNKDSSIVFNALVKDYLTNFSAKLNADGKIAASDLGVAAGEVVLPYLDLKGYLPVKLKAGADKKKFNLTGQIMADAQNYITPVIMNDLYGKQTVAQLNINKNNDTLKIDKTGIFVKNSGSEFSDNLFQNTMFSKEFLKVKGIISNLTFQPFISLFKVTMPHDMTGSLYIFKNSEFSVNTRLHAFGKPQKPNIDGNITIKDISVPEILTKIEKINVDLNSNNIDFNINNINANGSDFKINGKTTWNYLPEMKVFGVNVWSKFIDVNNVLKVSEEIIKKFPTSEPNREKRGIEERSEIPLQVLNGNIRLKKIVMDKIVVNNTTAKISLLKNILYVNNLKTYPLGGYVSGKASMNLISQDMATEVSGKNFDIEKVLLDVTNMKDLLSGKMNFVANLRLRGTEFEQQMRTLLGTVDFTIKNGQLGPFGKFENFLMAENIRENAFFSTAIGSIVNNLLSFNTSRFNELYGHLSFKDGIAQISPIKSQGDVMSMFIFGNLNLLDNTAEMKVRGKLASAFSDKLGPLANINPINLVKHTPGLNIVLAKTFSVFCESLSQEEMDAIPQLGEGKSDGNATKFQIRLKGDTRKPLKMIKSFKWLALDSEIESAKDFIDTIPTPEPGEEGLSVEELIKLREEQAAQAAQEAQQREIEAKKPINRIKKIFGYQPK